MREFTSSRRLQAAKRDGSLHLSHTAILSARVREGLTMNAPKTAYQAVTRLIEVKVAPKFLADRSSPENGYFFWAYTVMLRNRGQETVQLKTRHWRITDAQGRLQEVRGPGVVGE